MNSLMVTNLSDSQKNEVISIKNEIQFSYENTLQYGQNVTKNLSRFSNELLQNTKVRDNSEVEGFIMELMGGLQEIDPTSLVEKKKGWFSKFFKVDEVKNFITKYDNVAAVVQQISSKLEIAEFSLKKDIEVCEKHLEQLIIYINELDKYVMAGNMRLEESMHELDELEGQLDISDQLSVHQLSLRKDEHERFERKIHNLLLMREVAIQNIPQLRLIKDGNAVLVEKLQVSVQQAIPLWENQMGIAIHLMRQKGALAIQKAVTDTVNATLVRNSEMLKTNAIGVAKELERGVIDIETLTKVSDNLIETLKGVKNVRIEGKKARNEAVAKIENIRKNFNEILLIEAKAI